MNKGQVLENYCSSCLQSTKHEILEVHEEKSRGEYICDEYYGVVRCNGCYKVSFRYEFHDLESAEWHNEESNVPITVDVYPKSIKGHRRLKDAFYIPNLVLDAYNDAVTALSSGAKISAGLGFRAVIEAISIGQGLTGATLDQRIDELKDKGLISKASAQMLHGIRFLGNDAAHRITIPSDKQLLITLEIIEQTLSTLYILPTEATRTLDTVLTGLNEMVYFIRFNLHKGSFKPGDELAITELLGDKYRRFHKNRVDLVSALNDIINAGEFTELSIGKVDKYNKLKNVQYYLIV
ncbi:DUF4145 domain-containing protein [Peribacillus simplex]|uniref:DUF4145 domain-containing protein n=1 Tax=Peribacillus simplex TaxID=1478 RepID=UPI003D2BCE4F